MPHINEDTLIQYRFDLLEEDKRPAVKAHLDECRQCREHLEALTAKFSSLDLLGDEVEPSEVLVQKILRNNNRPATNTLWNKVQYYLSAAAVLIVAGLLYMVIQAEKKFPSEMESQPAATKTPAPQRSPEMKTDRLASADPRSTLGLLNGASSAPAAADLSEDTPARIIPPDKISDKAPFAPASAIELVVLPRRDTTQLTIYNSADLTLIRDTRKLTLKAGWNWLQFMWSDTQIDPTSLSLTPLDHADQIEIEQLVYPAGLKDIGRWLIRSEVEGAVPFEITYFTSGLSWRAFYMGTLNEAEDKMKLDGYVVVNNHSGEDYKNARTRLVIGEVHLLDEIADLSRRRYPYGPEFLLGDELFLGRRFNEKFPAQEEEIELGLDLSGLDDGRAAGMGGERYYDFKKIEKESLSEYYLYSIEGTETIPDGWGKRLPSLDADDIPVKSLYKYDEARYGGQTVRFLSFANDSEHELGDTPLPEGNIRIFRNLNEQCELAYTGSADTKYIPVNEDIELNLGPARLVQIEPVLMDTRTENYTFDKDGNISGWDEIQTWRIKLTNARNLPVDIEITRDFATEYWDLAFMDLTGRIKYNKHDATRARFTTTLPPTTEQVFDYTVTQYQQERAVWKAKQTQKGTGDEN